MALNEEIAEETDAGPRDRRGPERLCIAKRSVRPAAELLRFVVGPDGTVVPDLKRRLPGRGAWVTGTRAAVETAVARNAFARAFRRQVAAAPGLGAETERLIERSALDALAITGKAGLVEPGFAKVEAALAERPVVALLQAQEAAADGVRKVAAAMRRSQVTLPVLIFPGPQLDLALGRSNVIHAAVLAGPASETLLARYRSLERFRGLEPVGSAVEQG